MSEATDQPCDLPKCPYCPECGLSDAQTFAERLALWCEERDVLMEGLATESPRLVERLVEEFGGLRAAARACAVSPTYLTQVRKHNAMLSADRYLRLDDVLRRHKLYGDATKRVATEPE